MTGWGRAIGNSALSSLKTWQENGLQTLNTRRSLNTEELEPNWNS